VPEEQNKLGTVLVVDDVPDNIDVLKGVLIDEFNVKAATSGEKALTIAETALPDLILLDIMMPGMDGYEVCSRLKQMEATRDIPVVFVTALAEVVNEEKGFKVGCVDYLTKPISPSVALARVKTHIALRKAQQELQEWNSNLKSRVLSFSGTITGQVQRANELQLSHKGGSINSLIIALKGLMELLDMRHGTHATTVSRLASEAAHGMGLDHKMVRSIALGGLLHDIGKLGMPEYALTKPIAEMTENELKEYRGHPARSQFLVMDNEELQDVSQMVLHHHEAFDGKGFPKGLRGEEIPLGARLIAIADCIEHAAASVKQDKAEYALSKVKYLAGSMFDPYLLSRFRWPTRAVYFERLKKSGGVVEAEIPPQELTPGMQVTRDLQTEGGIMLAVKGTVLENANIALIQKYYATDPPSHGIFVALEDLDQEP
jgi:putative two-component system response regulator